jgi:hypothetical protein
LPNGLPNGENPIKRFDLIVSGIVNEVHLTEVNGEDLALAGGNNQPHGGGAGGGGGGVGGAVGGVGGAVGGGVGVGGGGGAGVPFGGHQGVIQSLHAVVARLATMQRSVG